MNKYDFLIVALIIFIFLGLIKEIATIVAVVVFFSNKYSIKK